MSGVCAPRHSLQRVVVFNISSKLFRATQRRDEEFVFSDITTTTRVVGIAAKIIYAALLNPANARCMW